MTNEFILGIDQGTTNSKALLVNRAGQVVAEATARVPVRFPAPGWVESDGDEVWESVVAAVQACLENADDPHLVAIGIANQRESVMVWDRRTGETLGPCISWQCRRTAAACDAWREAGFDSIVRARTGLSLDPLFSASKARFLLDRVEDAETRARRGQLCVGTVDSWLTWKLTSGETFATDLTNASRTLLLDLDALRWDEELASIFGIPIATLPEIRGSSALIATTRGAGPVPDGVPIAALVGDSHAALFGHGAPEPGTVKATYGTGTSVMTAVPDPVRTEQLSTTVAWALESLMVPGQKDVTYALEGNITSTGAALEWTASILGVADVAGLERLAVSVVDSDRVTLVPAFAGLGAPYWDADVRGLIGGLTRGTTPAHIARAAFDSVAYQVRDVVDVLRGVAWTDPSALIADGGAVRSSTLMQLQADVLDLPVLRAHSSGAAGLGATYLAGLAIGWWSVDDVRRLPRRFDRFEPEPRSVEAASAGYRGWREAVTRAVGQAHTPLRMGA